MYWKIISGGMIVDACDELSYVRWQEKNRMFLSCGAANADGIMSYDGGSIYLLEGAAQIGELPRVSFVEITKEEFDALRDELDAGNAVENQSTDTSTTATPAKTRLEALEDKMAALSEMNSMLVDCLLEMSEVVYSGE